MEDKIGTSVIVFGVEYVVTHVEPERDWYLSVEAESLDGEILYMKVPFDE